MSDVSDKTACVLDHGLFIPVAHRLAHDFGRVLYWTPHEQGFPTVRKAKIGDGFSDFEWCDDFWRVKDEIDVFVVCDIGLSSYQLELESQGFPVWGSRGADQIEINRERFLSILKQQGLDVAEHVIIEGLTKLREHLQDKEDKYIKISRWRGDMETTHWRNWELDEGFLDYLAIRFGPVKEQIPFLVFDNIDTDIEIGGDTYCIDGEWPSLMLNGTEWKDKAYFGIVTKRDDMPGQVADVLDAFTGEFERARYRGEFSCEIRVTDDAAYFIDPTCRGGLPSTASQLTLWKNFSEIVWSGAHGVLVNPEPAAKFSAECILKTKLRKDCWMQIEVPDELLSCTHFSNCCCVDGLICFPPDEQQEGEIGWMVATGNTPKETIEHMGEYVALLPDGLTAEYEALADIVREIENAESDGIPMTDAPMPEPAIVLEDK